MTKQLTTNLNTKLSELSDTVAELYEDALRTPYEARGTTHVSFVCCEEIERNNSHQIDTSVNINYPHTDDFVHPIQLLKSLPEQYVKEHLLVI